jgi:ABC-type dipeptide/oligopeptide/nickel transport system permease subunit
MFSGSPHFSCSADGTEQERGAMITNGKVKGGGTLILFIAAAVLFIPLFSGADPAANDLANRLEKPGPNHFLGTDHLGRDVFSRLLYGGRLSLGLSLIALFISLVTGLLSGLLAGYFRGAFDYLVTAINEILLAFPGMILSLAIVSIAGTGLTNAVFAVCMVSWTGYARIVRGMVLSLTGRDFVKAARISGSPDVKIILRHILPNVLGPVIIYAATNISSIIMQLASLSFLGLGVQPPATEWGAMMNEAKGYIATAPWLILAPGAALVLMIAAFNLLGEGLARALHAETGAAP